MRSAPHLRGQLVVVDGRVLIQKLRRGKWVAAATTAYLALGAAAHAVPAGYLALLAITADPGANYPFVFPLGVITVIAVGVPLIGAAGAYVLTSSQPKRLGTSAL